MTAVATPLDGADEFGSVWVGAGTRRRLMQLDGVQQVGAVYGRQGASQCVQRSRRSVSPRSQHVQLGHVTSLLAHRDAQLIGQTPPVSAHRPRDLGQACVTNVV